MTLGFSEIIRLTAVNLEWLGGNKGIPGISKPPSFGGDEGLFQIPHLLWDNGTVLIDTRDTTAFLKFGVLDQIPYYWMGLTAVFVVPAADVLIKNSRVGRASGGDARGRGRRRADGCPDLQVQAARVRDRRFRRRPGRWALRHSPELHQPPVVPAAVLDPVPRGRGRGWPGQQVGRDRRCDPRWPTCLSGSASSTTSASLRSARPRSCSRRCDPRVCCRRDARFAPSSSSTS
ncbi:hypothetical protein LP418_22600 [Nocardioides sp. B-3]|nr:hypothetical protein LP418_22600 [Nocardioides sp. B-3]